MNHKTKTLGYLGFFAIAGAMMLMGSAYAGCGSCSAHSTAAADAPEKGECCATKAKTAATKCDTAKACPMTKTAASDKSEHHKSEHKRHTKAAKMSYDDAHLTTDALAILVEARVPMVLLDARTAKYDEGKRIAHAKRLPPDATADEAAEAIGSKRHLVVTYCGGETCPLSKKLASQLREYGYEHVLEYPAGMEGWRMAGHAVTDTAKQASAK